MKKLSVRTEGFTDSVIRRMTRVCNRYGAVNLSQGFPDFEPPAAILSRLEQVAHEDFHQYAVTWGSQSLRDALAKKQSRFMGRPIDANSEIVVTCGSTEAMMAAVMTVTDPGDKLIVFSPFYENYGADVILAGAEPIYVPLHPPEFNFRPEELEAAFRQNPKALILCNPSNPSGKVFTREELLFIASLAEKYDAYVITDEVYEHIVYAPHEHVYFATLPGMWERTLSCSSLSKTYSITGWRIGYIIAPPEIVDVAKKVTAAGGSMFTIIYMVVIVGFFYFFLIRPQRKEQKEKQNMLSSLAVGDSVLTTAGFYGVVIDMTEDTVIVEFGNNKNCRIPMQKAAIVQIEKPEDAIEAAEDK